LSGLKLSKKDRLISIISQFISTIGPGSSAGIVSQLLLEYQKEFEKVVENLPYEHEEKIDTKVAAKSSYPEQRAFSFDWIVPGR
jgi:hypothetical protein